MKKIVTFNLIFLLAFGLFFRGESSSLILSKANAELSRPTSEVKVKVVNAPLPALDNLVARTSSPASVCQTNLKNSVDSVQPAQIINLNQPANCFSLDLASKIVVTNLLVKPLEVVKQSIAVQINTHISSAGLNSLPLSQSATPLLPVLYYGLLVSFLSFRKKIFSKTLNYTNYNRAWVFVPRLEVLRC